MSWFKTHFFSVVSRLIATYFIWAFHIHVGFPPTKPLTYTATIYLVLFTFFLVIPLAQRLKLGKLIEFDAKIEQVRADVRDVRTETRELISTVSVATNAISASMKQNVTVNIPRLEDLRAEKEQFSAAFAQSPDLTGEERDILEYMSADESDKQYVLARLRMDLERELRRILDEQPASDDRSRMRGKFLSARSLFQRLVSAIPRYKHMQGSFDYIVEICNAAIHGQQIPDNIAHEAIDMGFRMLKELGKEPKQ